MCGDRPEWKDKVGAWSMDDYHLALNGEKWASRIRNPGELEGVLIGNDTRFEIMGWKVYLRLRTWKLNTKKSVTVKRIIPFLGNNNNNNNNNKNKNQKSISQSAS
jgi:hypothetical protein